MRKLTAAILTLLLVGIIVGCSDETKEATESVQEVPDLVIEVEEEKAIDVIPNPEEIFSEGGVVMLQNEPDVFYQVKNYKDGEYDAYLQACKDAGFTDIHYEGETETTRMYWAYDKAHEYYLELGINEENGIIDIVCKKVEPKVEAVEE